MSDDSEILRKSENEKANYFSLNNGMQTFDDCRSPAEVGVGRRHIGQALVVSLVIVVLDEGLDVGFEVAGQEVVFQQDAVLEGLVPALDLALGLRVIRRAA